MNTAFSNDVEQREVVAGCEQTPAACNRLANLLAILQREQAALKSDRTLLNAAPPQHPDANSAT